MCSGYKDKKTGQKSNYGMEKHGLEQIHHTKLSESMFSRTYWKVIIYNTPHIWPYNTPYINIPIVEIVFDTCYISRYKDEMPINYYLVIFKGIFADFFQFVPREITSCRPFWLRLLEILIGKIYMTEYKIDLYMPYYIGHINPHLNFGVIWGRIIIEKLFCWYLSGWN